jgi:hypothetical protein
MLETFKQRVQFVAQGQPVANLTIGRGVIAGHPAYVAIIENRIASGAIGKPECDKLASLFKVVAAQKVGLALYLDSAGARISEGLPALGAFRAMYASAVSAALAGVPMLGVVGSNCYGGASMLAALCGLRYFNPQTRLAMSGPSILAAAAGASALDEAFRAIADVTIGTPGRLKLGAAHKEATASFDWPQMPTLEDEAKLLGERLASAKGGPDNSFQLVQRKDLELLYPNGYELDERGGIVRGTGNDADGKVLVAGSIDRRPMTAARALGLAQALAAMAAPAGGGVTNRVHILMDCEAHSASLDDEKLMLSSYLAHLARAVMHLKLSGKQVETVVLGTLGGGIYLALASASTAVHLVYGSQIQLLPGKAIAAILGQAGTSTNDMASYIQAGVAERELRIGMV